MYEGTDEDVHFSLHPVVDGQRVGASERQWTIGEEPKWSMELPEGDYWLIGSLPKLTENSQKIDFCIGWDCSSMFDEVEKPETKQGCQTMNNSTLLWWVSIVPFIIRRRLA